MDTGTFVADCPDEVFNNVQGVEVLQLAGVDGPFSQRTYKFTGGVQFNELSFFALAEVRGCSHRDWFTFSVRKETSAGLVLNRFASSPGDRIISVNNADTFSGICTAGYSAYNVSVRHSVLKRNEMFRNIDEHLLRATYIFSVSALLHEILLDQLGTIANDNDLCDVCMEENVSDIAMTLLASISRLEPISSSNRLRIVFDSIKHVRQLPYSELEVEDLAELVHCSVRTLQYAFRKTLGLSPMQYIRRYRLNLVRREILHPVTEPGPDISELARSYGFNHAGHFSRMYRDLFGSKPSDGCMCTLHEDAANDSGKVVDVSSGL